MNIQQKFSRAAHLPTIEGEIIIRNNYNAELHIPPSAIRNLQDKVKPAKDTYKQPYSYLVLVTAETFQHEYSIRCPIHVLHQAVKLAKWGYDVDLRKYSGEKAPEALETIAPLIQGLPTEELQAIIAAFARKPLTPL
jgi:hypothetical protein